MSARPTVAAALEPEPFIWTAAQGGLVAGSCRDEHGPMPFDVQQLLRLWTDPLLQE